MTPHGSDDELEHVDTGDCRCARCEREAIELAEARARRTAFAVGGIAPWAHEALGPGWVDADGKGGIVPEPVATEELAQRALGDVFEQLERIGASGRERCRTGLYSSVPTPREQRLKRHEAVKLLRFAENALDYARVHLDYLECEPTRTEEGYAKGDLVVVRRENEARAWVGTVIDASDAADELLVRDEESSEHIVPHTAVRRQVAV